MVWYYIAAEVGFLLLFFQGFEARKRGGIIEMDGKKRRKETKDAAEPRRPLHKNAVMD